MLYRCLAIAAVVYGILALVERSRPASFPKWSPLALSVGFPVGAWPMLQSTANGQAWEPYALAGFLLGLSLTTWRSYRRP